MARDLAAHDQSLAQVNSSAADWTNSVGVTDQRESELAAAQAAYDDALADEAAAKDKYERDQGTYLAACADLGVTPQIQAQSVPNRRSV